MRNYVPVSYDFILLDMGRAASPSLQDVIDGHKDNDDEGDFALLFQMTSMIPEK